MLWHVMTRGNVIPQKAQLFKNWKKQTLTYNLNISSNNMYYLSVVFNRGYGIKQKKMRILTFLSKFDTKPAQNLSYYIFTHARRQQHMIGSQRDECVLQKVKVGDT